MWSILKCNLKEKELLKQDFQKILGKSFKMYSPKIIFQKYKKNKLISKEYKLLGEYIFCYHDMFKDKKTLNLLKNSRGLKFFLNGFANSQNDINKFISLCKSNEDKNGYINQKFFESKLNSEYIFKSGPFTENIFKILEIQKNKFKIMMGKFTTLISKDKYIFKPV